MPRKRANPYHFEQLEHVTTLACAVREYKIHRSVLTYAIDAGLVAAVRCGKTVIIWLPSLMEYLDAK